MLTYLRLFPTSYFKIFQDNFCKQRNIVLSGSVFYISDCFPTLNASITEYFIFYVNPEDEKCFRYYNPSCIPPDYNTQSSPQVVRVTTSGTSSSTLTVTAWAGTASTSTSTLRPGAGSTTGSESSERRTTSDGTTSIKLVMFIAHSFWYKTMLQLKSLRAELNLPHSIKDHCSAV